MLAPRLLARLGPAALLRAGLVVEAVTHATLALTTLPLIAGAVLMLFGVQTTTWGIITTTLRQGVVPDAIRGRVTSVYALLETGGAALGSLFGGLFAQQFGLVAPFWAAAVSMVIITVASWRALSKASRA